MPNHIRPHLTILAFTFTLMLTVPTAAQTPVDYDNLSDEAISNWGQSEHVFQAKTDRCPGWARGEVISSHLQLSTDTAGNRYDAWNHAHRKAHYPLLLGATKNAAHISRGKGLSRGGRQ